MEFWATIGAYDDSYVIVRFDCPNEPAKRRMIDLVDATFKEVATRPGIQLAFTNYRELLLVGNNPLDMESALTLLMANCPGFDLTLQRRPMDEGRYHDLATYVTALRMSFGRSGMTRWQLW